MPHFEELFAHVENLQRQVDALEPQLPVQWGEIGGTLADQIDLQAALDSKLDDSQASAFGLSLLGAADAAAAQTLLALVPGTNVQAWDAELQAIAGLTSAADRLPYFTGSGTAALATFTAGGRALVNSAGTADTFPYFSASNTVTLGSLTAAGRALLDDASASAQRTTLGLGTGDSPTFAGLTLTGHLNAQSTVVIGNSAAIPANTQVLIDRLGSGSLPVLPGGTALTLQGNSSASNNNFLVNIAGTTGVAGIRFGDSGSATQGRIDYDNSTDAFGFYTNATLAMTLSSAGALTLVGAFAAASAAINTATLRAFATSGGTVTPSIQANGTGIGVSSLGLARWNTTAGAPVFVLGYSAGASVGTHGLVADTNVLGRINFNGSDGTAFQEAARIEAFVDGTPGAGDMPGGLRFMVSPDGSTVPAAALTIGQDKSATFADGIDLAGLLTGTNIYNTFTPTLTGITNVSASSANLSGWIRIGDAVLVFTQISVTATAAGALTVIDISLPVASNFSAATQCVGAGSILTAATEVAAVAISANATNDRARATFVSSSIAARSYTVMFGYIVI